MNSIFTVVAHFEDWDSTWFVNIGHFTSKDEAQSVKSKWETFFIKADDVFLESEIGTLRVIPIMIIHFIHQMKLSLVFQELKSLNGEIQKLMKIY